MFDFQKLEVYQISKAYHKQIRELIKTNTTIDKYAKDQLLRASMSVVLNIAEGTGRFSKNDKKQFYIISRSSVFECVAVLEILLEENLLSETLFKKLFDESEKISKILFALIQRLSISEVLIKS